MKEKQDTIYFMAGTSRKEVENSPFVERLLKKGYEVLYLIEPIDEYCIQVTIILHLDKYKSNPSSQIYNFFILPF